MKNPYSLKKDTNKRSVEYETFDKFYINRVKFLKFNSFSSFTSVCWFLHFAFVNFLLYFSHGIYLQCLQ